MEGLKWSFFLVRYLKRHAFKGDPVIAVHQLFVQTLCYWSSNGFKQNHLRYTNLFRCDSMNFTLLLEDALIFFDSLKKLVRVQKIPLSGVRTRWSNLLRHASYHWAMQHLINLCKRTYSNIPPVFFIILTWNGSTLGYI